MVHVWSSRAIYKSTHLASRGKPNENYDIVRWQMQKHGRPSRNRFWYHCMMENATDCSKSTRWNARGLCARHWWRKTYAAITMRERWLNTQAVLNTLSSWHSHLSNKAVTKKGTLPTPRYHIAAINLPAFFGAQNIPPPSSWPSTSVRQFSPSPLLPPVLSPLHKFLSNQEGAKAVTFRLLSFY